MTRRIALIERHASGLASARSLRAIGDDFPHHLRRLQNLRPVLQQWEKGLERHFQTGFFSLQK